PFAATAIGLAIALDREAGYSLTERLSRTFGVFRESEAGGDVVFDPIFPRDTALPAPGEPPVSTSRRYRAAHNIGHFRFLECGRIQDGHPDGDVTPWDELRFPFVPSLRGANLERVAVERLPRGEGPEVEERYLLDDAGIVEVKVTILDDGFSGDFRLKSPSSPL
ncbi:MAG TPA: Hsp70 family protein, partial [Thermoanaerobaculia bacterium]|nr:Hsp70 family protein [Thermoanaerobaculia bacterium]